MVGTLAPPRFHAPTGATCLFTRCWRKDGPAPRRGHRDAAARPCSSTVRCCSGRARARAAAAYTDAWQHQHQQSRGRPGLCTLRVTSSPHRNARKPASQPGRAAESRLSISGRNHHAAPPPCPAAVVNPASLRQRSLLVAARVRLVLVQTVPHTPTLPPPAPPSIHRQRPRSSGSCCPTPPVVPDPSIDRPGLPPVHCRQQGRSRPPARRRLLTGP